MIDERSLQLVAAGFKPQAFLFGLTAALPLLIILTILWKDADSGFASSDLTVLGSTAVFIVSLWAVLHLAMNRHRLQLNDDRLCVSTSFYTQNVALPELLLDKARVVDLDERPEFKPALKSNGYAMPGFRSGHFRLGNGERAFVATTGGRRVLWLPTVSGKGLLLQAQRPEALLQRLRELAQAHPRR